MKKQTNNTSNIHKLIDFLNKYKQKFTVKDNHVIADIIDLSNNNLTSLPESIGNIKYNNKGLSFKKLTSLLESIGNIKYNNKGLSFKKLTSLPESIGNI